MSRDVVLSHAILGQEKPGKKSPNSICNQKPETGDCRALFTRYYYDEMSGDCKHFTYGGCGGNANNFKKIEECRKKCLTEV